MNGMELQDLTDKRMRVNNRAFRRQNVYSRRVKNPANSVVDGLRLRECLVTTFMSNNPEAGGYETSSKCVQRPDRELGEEVKVWRGKGDVLGV